MESPDCITESGYRFGFAKIFLRLAPGSKTTNNLQTAVNELLSACLERQEVVL